MPKVLPQFVPYINNIATNYYVLGSIKISSLIKLVCWFFALLVVSSPAFASMYSHAPPWSGFASAIFFIVLLLYWLDHALRNRISRLWYTGIVGIIGLIVIKELPVLGWILLISVFLVWKFRNDSIETKSGEATSLIERKTRESQKLKHAQYNENSIEEFHRKIRETPQYVENQSNVEQLKKARMQVDLTDIAKDLKQIEAELTEEEIKEFLNEVVQISGESGSNVKEAYLHYLPTITRKLKEDMLFRIGQKYETGNGVEQNHSLALYYYHRAALDGSDKAYNRLGFGKNERANTEYHLNQMAEHWRKKSGVKTQDDASLPNESTKSSLATKKWLY